MKTEPFGANQIDSTGGGDSFLGGFVGGLVHSLSVHDAALVANVSGSVTIAQIGLLKFDLRLLRVCFVTLCLSTFGYCCFIDILETR